MKNIRILFTAVGRRIELIQAFRDAALVLGKKLIIYGTDISDTAPALAYCDRIRNTCAMRDPDYIPQLLDICVKDQIDMVIPTIDTDLQILAEHAADFANVGCKVLISSPEMVRICRDKNYTSQFFADCGLHAPMPVNDYTKYSSGYPAFIKPKNGSSSIDAYKVNNSDELAFYASQIKDYIIQPFVEGTEFTVDIFCDFDGNIVSIVPRKRVIVRAGEVLKTEICMDRTIIGEAEKLIARFKPCGPLTVQLIRNSSDNIDYYIEINPRYGGGAPLSMKAGAKSAESILRLLSGENVTRQSERSIADGAVFSRFDQSVCTLSKKSSDIRGVIFDLDDTLYSEKEYVLSGFAAVAEYLGESDYARKMWNYFAEGKVVFKELLAEIGRQDEENVCLEIYREHFPNINLYDGVAELIKSLRENGIKVGVITDGRPSGQRAKIKASGLSELIDDFIITDELGGVAFRKPNDISFRIMQTKWQISFEEMVYVGDNIAKDFQAPRQLGMQTVYFNNTDGLYYDGNSKSVLCDHIVDSPKEMQDYVRKITEVSQP